MSRLAELLPFYAGHETVASYFSRLAAACGYENARAFAFHLQLQFQGIVAGREKDLETFAAVLDMPRSSLSAGVILGDKYVYQISGQVLSRHEMQRLRFRFCPFCVSEDEHRCGGRRGFRAYGRLHWHVSAIRTCKRHGVRLISSAELAKSPFQHDFAANLAAESSRIPRSMASAEAAEPDNLQTYVEKRLKGDRSGADWLDSLPLYVAIRLCEIVGASLLHGNLFRSSGFGDREWSESSGAGYDLLKEGEPAFRQYLQAQVDDFHRRKVSGGERSIFGRLYLTLAHRTTEAAFDPIRDIIRDVAIHNLPLGPGDEFFGPIAVRKFHTIHSASKAHGIPFERLNKLVLDAGLLPSETSGRGRNLIEAQAVDRIVTEMAATFNQKEVATKLGVTRKLGRQLINGGLFKPSFEVKQRPGTRIIPRYPAEQVTTLLASLRSVANCTDMSELHDLHTSIKRCGCTFIEAINLIRSEKLSKVGWDKSEIGLAALRVDPIEMRLLMMRQNSIISDRQSKRSMVRPQPHGSPNRQSLL
ncbi:TniQ family protein [Agrobacterium rhizogenes]|uniref:TniQ family protein n=1 Tax=Rhizobium rhizogenes TaxID=359 RepID=UPI0022B5EE14|nr:TniQ family protein [Rhizobium rhizogenes]MCZ7449566.1 TniQ family protein [Rhizobium rhizogenes]